MCAAYEVEIVFVQELGHNLDTERERDASIVLTPARDVLVRIGPEKIAEETLVGHVGRSHDASDLLHGLQVGREAAVAAEDLLVDDGCHGQAVKAVGERLPQLDVVASFALVVEAVDAVDRCALVVAAQQEKVLGEFDLVGEQETDGLERLLAAVHVVAKEQIVRLWWKTTVFEQPQ